MERKAYPSDVRDDEWALVTPYLTLRTEDAPLREHSLREVFCGLCWLVRAGAAWRMLPHDLPPWHTGYQQSHRWLKAGVFEAIVHDLRAVLRLAQAAQEAHVRHMQLKVVKLSAAKKGFVLLPKRWVVERSNAWAARFRRLTRDYEQLAETLAGLHFVAFTILMLKRFVE
jgi:transposase